MRLRLTMHLICSSTSGSTLKPDIGLRSIPTIALRSPRCSSSSSRSVFFSENRTSMFGYFLWNLFHIPLPKMALLI